MKNRRTSRTKTLILGRAMPLERRKYITRQMLRAAPDTLFVFGDNLARHGMGGQAKEMRGEDNAVGLPTKCSPYQYMDDGDLPTVMAVAANDIDKLRRHLRAGGKVIWPSAGIGTGLADLEYRAPSIAKFYDGVLADLIDNVATQDS